MTSVQIFAYVCLGLSTALCVKLCLRIIEVWRKIKRGRALNQRFNIECALCERRQSEGNFREAEKHLRYMAELHEAHKAALQ